MKLYLSTCTHTYILILNYSLFWYICANNYFPFFSSDNSTIENSCYFKKSRYRRGQLKSREVNSGLLMNPRREGGGREGGREGGMACEW